MYLHRNQSCIQVSEDPKTVPDEREVHYPSRLEKRSSLQSPCKECSKSYFGENKRTLKIRLGEHKQAEKRGDLKNGIAVHAHESNHAIDWDEAKVRSSVSGYWQQRVTKAILIKKTCH